MVEIHELLFQKQCKGATTQETDNNIWTQNNLLHWCQVAEWFIAPIK